MPESDEHGPLLEFMSEMNVKDAEERLKKWMAWKKWVDERRADVLKIIEALPASGEQEFDPEAYTSMLCWLMTNGRTQEPKDREWITSDTRASIRALKATRRQVQDLNDRLNELPIKSRTALSYTLVCEEEGEDAATSYLPWGWDEAPFSDFLEEWNELLDEKRSELLVFAEAIETAIKVLERDPNPAARRPKESTAASVASYAAFIYREVTGTEATVPIRDGRAYGPFLSFLTDLFEVMEIDASPESQAKAARRKRLKHLRKNPQGLDVGDRLSREMLMHFSGKADPADF